MINQASAYVSNGSLVADLGRLIAQPSISQSEGRPENMLAYLTTEIKPMLEAIGFSASIHDNPKPNGAPLLIAKRIEDEALPTVLVYGHGDVCNGEASRWREGLQPFSLTVEGDKLYGPALPITRSSISSTSRRWKPSFAPKAGSASTRRS